VKSLWSVDDFGADDGVAIGFLVLLLAVVVVVGALVKPARILALIGGGLALVVTVVYLVQAARVAEQINDAFPGADLGMTDVGGPGSFLAVLAAIVATVGGILLLTQKR
jgi:hypothetical protein